MAETCCLSFDSLQHNKINCNIVIAHNDDEPPKDYKISTDFSLLQKC